MKRQALGLLCAVVLMSGCSARVPALPTTPTPEQTPTVTSAAATPSPAAPTPTATAYAYTFTPYTISSFYNDAVGTEAVQLAQRILDAYLAYETSVPCTDSALAQNALLTAAQCCPPFAAFARYNELHPCKNGTLSWKMKQTRAEHEAMLQAFQARVNEYFSVLRQNDTEAARAMALYRALVAGSRYDDSYDGKTYDEVPEALSCYHFLMEQSGVCTGYADAYQYLLGQAGIDAAWITGQNSPGALHMWVLMKLDGKLYFSDPTWEASPTQLTYFAFSQAWRCGNGGGFSPDDMRLCNKKALQDYSIADTRFEALHTEFGAALVADWRFNEARTGILYTNPDGEEKSFPLLP